MLMLCVVGMHGCGKSVFLSVAQEYNYTVVSMGDAVRAETARRGLPPEHHGEVAKALREEHGLGVVAHLVLDTITAGCIVDGVRGLEEITVFKGYYPVDILAVHASPRTRFYRVRKRQRAGDPTSWEAFKERDYRELTFGIGDVIALADYMLINESTKEQFERACRAFLEERGNHNGSRN